jgi:hypothetical protein
MNSLDFHLLGDIPNWPTRTTQCGSYGALSSRPMPHQAALAHCTFKVRRTVIETSGRTRRGRPHVPRKPHIKEDGWQLMAKAIRRNGSTGFDLVIALLQTTFNCGHPRIQC